MKNTVFRSVFRRAGDARSNVPHRDTGAPGIVILMMSLVFVPIVLAHVAATFQDRIPALGTGQIVSFVNMLLPQSASN